MEKEKLLLEPQACVSVYLVERERGKDDAGSYRQRKRERRRGGKINDGIRFFLL